MEKEDQDRFFEFEIGLFVRPTVSDHITAAESAGGKILKVGQYLAGVLRLVSAFSNHTVNTVVLCQMQFTGPRLNVASLLYPAVRYYTQYRQMQRRNFSDIW